MLISFKSINSHLQNNIFCPYCLALPQKRDLSGETLSDFCYSGTVLKPDYIITTWAKCWHINCRNLRITFKGVESQTLAPFLYFLEFLSFSFLALTFLCLTMNRNNSRQQRNTHNKKASHWYFSSFEITFLLIPENTFSPKASTNSKVISQEATLTSDTTTIITAGLKYLHFGLSAFSIWKLWKWLTRGARLENTPICPS